MDHSEHEEEHGSYKPLYIIVVIILSVALLVGVRDYIVGTFSITSVMSNFMAGFFLVFSGFKFLDLKGFAAAYSSYDLLARKVFFYGYIYPFIEFALGIAYLLGVYTFELNIITIFVMVFGGLGVLETMSKDRKFECACLGTVIKVPLSNVTLIEDFGMATMALLMLLL